MTKDVKYPVKYAVLELKEPGGWSNHYEDVIQGYVASKCYIIETSVRYYSDSSRKIYHKVVFPYQDITCFKINLNRGSNYIGERTYPRLDACNNIYPVNTVGNLYDTFEEASLEATQRNLSYSASLCTTISLLDADWKAKYEELKDDFEERLRVAKLFESEAKVLTEDMQVSEVMKLVKKG